MADVCLEDFTTPAECDGDSAPGAAADIRTSFSICEGQGPSLCQDSYFQDVITFIPAGFSVPAGGDIRDGSVVGKLSSRVTLGLLNNPCNISIFVAFTLIDSTVDNSAGNLVDPKPPGRVDVLKPLALDTNPLNGIPDGVDRYPSFLNTLFDLDAGGPLSPLVPRARLFATAWIQDRWTTLNLMVFEPGQSLPGIPEVSLTLGYPVVAVFDDPTAPSATGVIGDLCAPVVSELVVFGLTRDNPCTPAPAVPPAVTELSGCPFDPYYTPGPFDPYYTGGPTFPCENALDDDDTDADGKVNDGCPIVNFIPDSAGECAPFNDGDEDQDGTVNDGCPQVGSASESGAQCNNANNDDGYSDPLDNGYINDGCPAAGAPEPDFSDECANNTSDDSEDFAVNDGCPQVGAAAETDFLADPDGCDADDDEASCTYRRNPPSDGSPAFVTYATSLRDADDDGIENQLDVCALIANPEWKPREVDPVHDTDLDGLPNVCDPAPNDSSPPTPSGCPAGNTGKDHDQDCLPNREDNCPLTPNYPPGDRDSDGIGDDCDPATDSPDGHQHSLCLVSAVSIGDGGAVQSTDVPPCGTPGTPPSPSPTPAPTATATPAPTPTPTARGAVELPRTGGSPGAPRTGSEPRPGALAGVAAAGAVALAAGGWYARRRMR